MRYFYDTSSILNGNFPTCNDFISSTVLRELENIKNAGNNKSEEIKHRARIAARYLIEHKDEVNIFMLSNKQWISISKNESFIDTPDNRILAELLTLKKTYPDICLHSNDICLLLLAKKFNIQIHHAAANEKKGGIYYGYKEFDDSDFSIYNAIIEHPENNILKLYTNEYCILKNKEKDNIFKWNGYNYSTITEKNISNKFLGSNIAAKDIYQKIGIDLLRNKEIPVKLIQGKPGSGKDFIMTSVALELVMSRKKEKIVFIRNLIDLKDAPQIGYLQGSLDDKITWGADCIKDIVGGQEGYDYLVNDGIIEQVNLGFIRGRNFGPNYIIYVTEGQNLTESAVQSILSRAAEGTEVWINADLKQIDKRVFEQNNGVLSLQQNLMGNPLFGAAFFPNTHRSKVAELSGLLTSY